jgi:hypothetical protein
MFEAIEISARLPTGEAAARTSRTGCAAAIRLLADV